MENLRFGIIGCGYISPKFIKAAEKTGLCTITAVAARDEQRAVDFAAEFCPSAAAYGDYAALCADENVDAVYIATPHSHHLEHALLAINNKKHVLCEKVLTTDMGKLNAMFDAAAAQGVLLVENMWSRFLPSLCGVKSLLDSKALGEVVDFKYTFGFDCQHRSDEDRLLAAELAGGAIFDLGVYALNSVLMMTDEMPTLKDATMKKYKTGVDGESSFVLKFKNYDAKLHISLVEDLDNETRITLTKGVIVIPDTHRGTFYYVRKGNMSWRANCPGEADFSYIIEHFVGLLRDGKLDSDVFGRKQSSATMSLIDDFRAQVGLVYPFDEQTQPQKSKKER